MSVLPDCPHVGKCLKGSFAIWFLQSENERGNLALIATLRNRSDPRTKITLKGYLPKNDDVKNKDRHDPSAVLRLTNKKLLDFLENAGHVCHTLIPELVKFTEKNKVGMYANPIDIKTGPLGHIIFLTLNRESKLSNLYNANFIILYLR